MARFTFADVLPTAGSTAPLLLAAMASPHPLGVGKLASAARISKFAASRAAGPLLETGLLLRDDYDELSFNRNHPLAPTLVQLAWRYSGVQLPQIERSLELESLDWGEGPQSEEYGYREVLPEPLWLESPADSRLDALTGPTLVRVRDTVTALNDLTSELRGFERDSQAVYSEWKNERHRDFIHQVLDLGASTSKAASSLRRVANDEAQGDDDPRLATVSGRAWLRATYLVSAEAWEVRRVIRILATAVDRGNTLHRLREDALFQLHTINHAGRASKYAEKHLSQALQNEADASALWSGDALADHGRYMFIGGSPRPVDVGTSGDQLLAVRLTTTLERLARQVSDMTAEPGISAWPTLFVAEKQKVEPLLTVVPRNLLRQK